MKESLRIMHQVWDKLVIDERRPTKLPEIDFNSFISEVFMIGPFYYYLIDFYDLTISNISEGFVEAHGIEPVDILNINDVLTLVHPEDLGMVSKAEEKALAFMQHQIGMDKIKSCKFSYNFRFKNASGGYDFYNHQSLILTTDEHNNFIKSLNIHTNISHLTDHNTNTFSIIGLNGLPSFLNIPIFADNDEEAVKLNNFSNREIEIIQMIADGLNSRGIADRLFISQETVKSHRKNILRKSGCTSSTELVARSVSEGWI
jgi:DNA-binding CsgD family transcriptional regulator